MYVLGDDDESRLLRKTLCQNCNLMIALYFRSVSESVRSNWKTLEDFVRAGNAHFILFFLVYAIDILPHRLAIICPFLSSSL